MLYYVMPYVAGESLRVRLARDKQLPVEEALEIARILAGALTYAHAHGVIHRDIKPGNILFEAGHPILVDFGIARAVSVAGEEPLTVSGVAMGTPAYMSPEQASGQEELDGRSDIYSLACVLYEMLSGTPPFTGTTAAVILARHLTDPVPSLRAVRSVIPVHVEEAILHALAKTPATRFATPAEFGNALSGRRAPAPELLTAPEEAAPGPPPVAPPAAGSVAPTSVVEPTVPPAGLRWGQRTLVGVAIGIGAVALAVGLRMRERVALNPRRIVVAAFANRTGDTALTALGQLTADWITRGLALTGVLEIADPGGLLAEGDGRPVAKSGAEGTEFETARALALATGSALLVWGTIYPHGDSVELSAQITDLRSGRRLLSMEPVLADAAEPRPALITLSQHLMAGLAQAVDERFSDPALVAGQPPRYDAYVAFATGLDLWYNQTDGPAALSYFLRAAALDSTYALPLIHAAGVYSYVGRCDSTELLAGRVARRPLTRFEEPHVKLLLARCRGDLPAAYALSQQLAKTLPGSEIIRFGLVREAMAIDRPGEALAILRQLHPDRGPLRDIVAYYVWLATAYHWRGDHRRELQAAEEANGKFGNLGTLRLELTALAALGRVSEVNKRLDEIGSVPASNRYRGSVMRETALELAAHGHASEGRAVLDWELAWLASRPTAEQATEFVRFERAQTLYAAGLVDSSRVLVEELNRADPKNENYAGLLGVLAVQRGDHPEAERLDSVLAGLERPRGTAAFWRACIAARLSDRDQAMAHLERARALGNSLFQNAMDRTYWHILGPHVEPSFAALRGYPPFEALLRPKG
jgi:tetratricopeptide (TPR) repeat protein